MTSLIKVDNIAPSAGGTEFSLTRGVAKAWVNFDGTGTIATNDSLNISSLTDSGTGHYRTNFTNGMGNDDYMDLANTTRSTNVTAASTDMNVSCVLFEPTTTYAQVKSGYPDSVNTVEDAKRVSLGVWGDLA